MEQKDERVEKLISIPRKRLSLLLICAIFTVIIAGLSGCYIARIEPPPKLTYMSENTTSHITDLSQTPADNTTLIQSSGDITCKDFGRNEMHCTLPFKNQFPFKNHLACTLLIQGFVRLGESTGVTSAYATLSGKQTNLITLDIQGSTIKLDRRRPLGGVQPYNIIHENEEFIQATEDQPQLGEKIP